MTLPSDESFVRLAIEKRLVSEDQVKECRAAAQDMAREGEPMSLRELLIQFGYLSPGRAAWIEQSLRAGSKKTPRKEFPRFGGYELIGPLGRGGMAVVYLARREGKRGLVALKIIHPEMSARTDVIERLLRETRALFKLVHRNIVRGLEFGNLDGQFYLSMEFVQGQTLKSYVKQNGPVSQSQALEWIEQIAHALDHAHRSGFIHRDIKPKNLILGKDNQVKILDFGLTKSVLGDDQDLTQEGHLLGTVLYAAPEQLRGSSEIDGRADIYSLGITLYFLLAGDVPFRGPTTTATAALHLEQPLPNLKAKRPELSEAFCRLLDRMTRKSAAARYQTADQLLDDIQLLRAEGRISEEEPREQPSSEVSPPKNLPALRSALVFFSLACLAVAFTAILLLYRQPIITGPSGPGESAAQLAPSAATPDSSGESAGVPVNPVPLERLEASKDPATIGQDISDLQQRFPEALAPLRDEIQTSAQKSQGEAPQLTENIPTTETPSTRSPQAQESAEVSNASPSATPPSPQPSPALNKEGEEDVGKPLPPSSSENVSPSPAAQPQPQPGPEDQTTAVTVETSLKEDKEAERLLEWASQKLVSKQWSEALEILHLLNDRYAKGSLSAENREKILEGIALAESEQAGPQQLLAGHVLSFLDGELEVVYDFSDPSQLKDWYALSGNWEIGPGGLRRTSTGRREVLWWRHPHSVNFHFSYEAQGQSNLSCVVAGDGLTVDEGNGLLCSLGHYAGASALIRTHPQDILDRKGYEVSPDMVYSTGVYVSKNHLIFRAGPQLELRGRLKSDWGVPKMAGGLRLGLYGWGEGATSFRQAQIRTALPDHWIELERSRLRAELRARSGLLRKNFTLQFDGKDSYAIIPCSESIDLSWPFTLEFWFFIPETVPGRRATLVSLGREDEGLSLILKPAEREVQLGLQLGSAKDQTAVAVPLSEPFQGRWHHLALTSDGKEATTYLDGKRVRRSLKFRRSDLRLSSLVLGTGAGGAFQGEMDDFRFSRKVRYDGVFNPSRPLSPDEESIILLNFNEGEGNISFNSAGPENFLVYLFGVRFVAPLAEGDP